MNNLTTEQQDKKPKLPPKSKLNWWTRLYWKYLTLKNKLNRIEFGKEKITINFIIGLAFFSIAIGLVIFIGFLFKLSKDYSISSDSIIIEKSGQVGDFVGGIVGAIWSLTGVLLFYATLRLQSRELAENRKHFQMSRLTDIIYKQLDLLNAQISNFKLKDIVRDSDDEHIEHKGKAAISLMRHRVESILQIDKVNEDEREKQKVALRFMVENFAFIEINKNNLLNIYEELDNHVSVIRAVLIKEDIPPADLNELKSLFFRNVGRDFLNASELLEHYLDLYIKFQQKQNKEKEDDIFSPEHTIKRKIGLIEEFRKKRYDAKTIKEYLRSRDMYNATSF